MADRKVPFLGDFINGKFVFPKKQSGNFDKVDPGDLKQTLLQVSFSFDHVTQACEAAHKAFRPWADLPTEKRIGYLKRLKEIYIEHLDLLAETISLDVGKPLWEAKTEAQAMVGKIDLTINESLKLIESKKFEKASGNADGYLRFKPRGVLAVLGPFNFPGHLPNGQIMPALLSGNTVVFKPSELTATVGQVMAQLFEKADFPPGVFNVIHGGGESGKRLVMNNLVEGVLFTGSYETGFKIKQDILPHFWKICALEMGGKNSAVVWKDADLKKAVYECAVGAFITTGQRCSSTSRVIVHKSVADQFVSNLHQLAKSFTIGYGLDNPFMGPLINGSAVDRYVRFQGIATREGCESIMRGKVLEQERDGHYVTPSICMVKKPDASSVYQKTELFGPNVAIYVVDDFGSAMDIVNASSYGLVMSVFSKDKQIYEDAFRLSRVGLVNWNRSTVGASGKLPFGGMGKSGNNEPAGNFAIYTCNYPVASLEDESEFDPSKTLPGLNYEFKE